MGHGGVVVYCTSPGIGQRAFLTIDVLRSASRPPLPLAFAGGLITEILRYRASGVVQTSINVPATVS